jgi:ribosomal protein S18 acetylase RimI-like enzyme
MNEITLRIATIEDCEVLAKLRVEFLSEILGPQQQELADRLTHELTDYFRTAVPNGQYVGAIAWQGSNPVGAGGMVFRQQPGSFKNTSGKSVYILNMYTLPQFRRRGIGSSLLEMLLDDARSKGYYSFELHATPDGEPLYRKLGFHKHSEPTYRQDFMPMK